MINGVGSGSSTTVDPDTLAPPKSDDTSKTTSGGAGGGAQEKAAGQGVALQAAETQTSVWDSFLSNLPEADPDFENPLLSIPGTTDYASDPSKYNAYVASVLVDPADTVADEDLPANYNNPSPQEFVSWHPAVQLRYLRDNFTDAQIQAGNTVIGSGSNQVGVIRSDDKRSVTIVNELTKSRIFQLSKTEQERLANNSVFKTRIAPLLDLLPNADTDLAASRAVITAQIDKEINDVKNKTLTNKTSSSDQSKFNADKQAYVKQLEMLRDNVPNTGIYARSDLATEMQEIVKRFERAHAYFDVKTPNLANPARNSRDVLTPDNNASINRGYAVFIEQEQRILAIKQAEQQMLSAGGITNSDGTISRLDLPTLVALIQNQASLKQQAIITMRTEQLTQLNQLSQAYAEMQRIVNEALKKFVKTGKDADGEKHSLSVSFDNPSQFSTAVAYMFEDYASGKPHPVEKEFNITRPTHDMINNGSGSKNSFKRTQWERFSTQLSDAVTLLNPQLLTNDINQDNREQNRSYEQATGTVRRSFDLNIQIARGFS
ncbi:hypothetical protein SAMN04488518_11882 [Pseudovibrio ascidiaceicola]|uniref:Uncharacterized protein n=1 Tax=Pseudovibrio ascidiaceicola TaxID=285279 RepID=A0A1I4FCK7_9HYPH|nr:hypothetical protein [Pseudovibrio ascidiaceicola]SFL15638.1 hypothetical protein SAMN04488518_11882 [Pseudovibrio ascidiaceicola]